MLRGFLSRYHTEDDGQPQGGGADGGKPSDVLERYGRDALKLAEKLAEVQTDNFSLRDQRRELKRQLADLGTKVPGEGSVILTAEDAAALDAYRALGATADLQTALSERQTLAETLAARDRQDALRSAAQAMAYDADVLTTLAGDLPITVREIGDGKEKKPVAFISDAAGKEYRLDAYAADHWAKFLPSLAPKNAPGDGVGSPAGGRKPATPPELTIRPRATI